MYCTFVSLAVALYFIFNQIPHDEIPDTHLIGIIFIVLAVIFVCIQSLVRGLAWEPLQHAELQSTPHILEMYRKDGLIRSANLWLRLFPLLTLLLVIDLLFTNHLPKNYLMGAWVVFFGVSLDAIHFYQRRVLDYLNPFAAVSMFTEAAKKSIKEEQEDDLPDWINGLTEVSIKGIENNNTSLANHAVNETQFIARNYLEAQKSISHIQEDVKGDSNRVSYMMFYLFQRLESINEKAIQKNYESICSNIISVLGKITIYSAKFDITMTTYPLHFIGKLSRRAEEKGFKEVSLKTIFVLLEVAKGIINETDITYMEIKEPFFSIINHMNGISQEMFKRDKTTNLQILTQPFRDLEKLFQNEKFMKHLDAPAINAHLKSVLAEWEALEMVLKTIPPLPNISEVVPDKS